MVGEAEHHVRLEESGHAVGRQVRPPDFGFDGDLDEVETAGSFGLDQLNVDVGDGQAVLQEQKRRFMEAPPFAVGETLQSLPHDVQTPDEGSRAVAIAADASFQPGEQPQLEQSPEDAGAGPSGGRLGGVRREVQAAQLPGSGVAMAVDEVENVPVSLAEPIRKLMQIAAADARLLDHRRLPTVPVRRRWISHA